MKEQDDFLQKKFAQITSPDRSVRRLQEQMQERASEPRDKQTVSPFSPAQRAMFDTVSSGSVLTSAG